MDPWRDDHDAAFTSPPIPTPPLTNGHTSRNGACSPVPRLSVESSDATTSHPLKSPKTPTTPWLLGEQVHDQPQTEIPNDTNLSKLELKNLLLDNLTRPTLRHKTSLHLSSNNLHLSSNKVDAHSAGLENGLIKDSDSLSRNSFDSDVDDFESGTQVVIHKVQQGDTLAGISLFYGIDLTTLKRCNKLWTSDSIHMRKELALPIDACTIFQAAKFSTETKVIMGDDKVTILKKALPSDTTTTCASLPITRLPASSLSHFPPSNNASPRTSMDALSTSTSASQQSTHSQPSAAYYVIDRVLQIGEQIGDTIKQRQRDRDQRRYMRSHDVFLEPDIDGVILGDVSK